MPKHIDPDIITVGEAAQMLRHSPETIRKRAAELGGFKVPGGKRWLFRRSRIDALLAGPERVAV